MASGSTDFVTVAELKFELSINQAVVSHDVHLGKLLDEAVTHVADATGLPLIDRTNSLFLPRPDNGDPLYFTIVGGHVKSVSEIRYWTTGAALRSAPDGTIAGADLGRLQSWRSEYNVWPPAAGWPEVITKSHFVVDLARGVVINSDTRHIRRPIVIYVRETFNGFRDFQLTQGFKELIYDLKDITYGELGEGELFRPC